MKMVRIEEGTVLTVFRKSFLSLSKDSSSIITSELLLCLFTFWVGFSLDFFKDSFRNPEKRVVKYYFVLHVKTLEFHVSCKVLMCTYGSSVYFVWFECPFLSKVLVNQTKLLKLPIHECLKKYQPLSFDNW